MKITATPAGNKSAGNKSFVAVLLLVALVALGITVVFTTTILAPHETAVAHQTHESANATFTSTITFTVRADTGGNR